MNKKVEKALNAQINAEIWSAYLYLSMSTHFASEGFNGFSGWMKKQYGEEMEHAFRFMDYIVDRGGKVALAPVAEVPVKFGSPLEIFEQTLEHEKVVTDNIHKLVDLARSEEDKATESMLKWYVDEQVEEEATASGIVDKLKLIDKNISGLFYMDSQLGVR
ncbi:MAG: ferritin [Candidatus Azobacteroides sp.]|nr:ferritin [Candidatus Azobacteroides sp.]